LIHATSGLFDVEECGLAGKQLQGEDRVICPGAASLFIYGFVGISHIPFFAFRWRGGMDNLAPAKRRPGFRRPNRGS
jgi:hypothetical protein